MEKIVSRITGTLKTLGTAQVLSGVAAIAAIFLFVSHEILDMVGEDIMMDGKSIEIVALLCMCLVAAAGVVSVFRLRWDGCSALPPQPWFLSWLCSWDRARSPSRNGPFWD